MEMLYYTVAAVVLYAVSDALLQRLEIRAGRRFEYRTPIFFAILLTLAMTSFYLIRRILS